MNYKNNLFTIKISPKKFKIIIILILFVMMLFVTSIIIFYNIRYPKSDIKINNPYICFYKNALENDSLGMNIKEIKGYDYIIDINDNSNLVFDVRNGFDYNYIKKTNTLEIKKDKVVLIKKSLNKTLKKIHNSNPRKLNNVKLTGSNSIVSYMIEFYTIYFKIDSKGHYNKSNLTMKIYIKLK